MNFPAAPVDLSRVDLSMIIVARNEAAFIGALLQRLTTQHSCAWHSEIVLCDGGSSDDTVEIARKYSAIITTHIGGRGAQLQRGAQIARGNWLWFLHADSYPAHGSVRSIFRATRQNSVVGGNFRLRFGSDQIAARLFENIARAQRSLGIYYGDSGIWVRRDIYEKLGGFRDWPLFEDFDFVRRLERFARDNQRQTRCLRPALCASARRFERHPWRVLGLWARLQWQFSRGVSPQKLARWYREHHD